VAALDRLVRLAPHADTLLAGSTRGAVVFEKRSG